MYRQVCRLPACHFDESVYILAYHDMNPWNVRVGDGELALIPDKGKTEGTITHPIASWGMGSAAE